MAMRVISFFLLLLVILSYICPFSSSTVSLNNKNIGFQTMLKQASFTTFLLAFKETTAHEDLANNSGLEAKNMSRFSQIITKPSSPHVLPSNLAESNTTFDEKKREDAYEKKPAAESPHAVLLHITTYHKVLSTNTTSKKVCSGTLLTPDWVLTAAHCIKTPPNTEILVYAGGYSIQELTEGKNMAQGSQLRIAKSILPHPKYKGNIDYDIGLLMVSKSFDITDTVKTLNISTQPWDHRGYRTCQLTGFGAVQLGEKSSDDIVRKTHTLEAKQPCSCSFRLKMLLGPVSHYICAKPRLDYGVCEGDSGGGLVCDGQVRAVAMMLIPMLDMNRTCSFDLSKLFSGPRCGSIDTLSVFQDVCPSLGWINSHVRLFNDSQIPQKCAASTPVRAAGLVIVLVIGSAIC